MKTYIFQAALICEDCSHGVQGALVKPDHVDMHDESSYDSDEWPKGPYPDGGGEADSPQHCAMCHVFLNNPLTPDGSAYVKKAWRYYAEMGVGSLDVLKEWRDAYPCDWSEYGQEEEERFARFEALAAPWAA